MTRGTQSENTVFIGRSIPNLRYDGWTIVGVFDGEREGVAGLCFSIGSDYGDRDLADIAVIGSARKLSGRSIELEPIRKWRAIFERCGIG